MTKPVPNFTRLDSSRPDVAVLINAMLRVGQVVAALSWASSQEPITESWWAYVLADPRARHCQVARGTREIERRDDPSTKRLRMRTRVSNGSLLSVK